MTALESKLFVAVSVLLGCFFFEPAHAQERQVEPELDSVWLESVPVYPDGVPQGRAGFRSWPGQLPTEPPMTDVAVGADGSVYWLANIKTGKKDKVAAALLVKYDAAGKRVWHKLLDDWPNDDGLIMSMTLDSEDNLYLAGAYSRGRGADGATYGCVLSFTATGKERWDFTMSHAGQGAQTYFMDVAVKGDSVFAVGWGRGRVTRGDDDSRNWTKTQIVRLRASDGRRVWAKQYASSKHESSKAVGAVFATNGQLYVLGNVDRYRTGPNDHRDRPGSGFVIGVSPSTGKEFWRTMVGRPAGRLPRGVGLDDLETEGWGIAAGPDGGVYVTGYTLIRLDGIRVPSEKRTTEGSFLTRLEIGRNNAGRAAWIYFLRKNDERLSRGYSPGRMRFGPDGMLWIPGVVAGNWGPPALIRFNPAGDLLSVDVYAESDQFDSCDAVAFGPGGGAYITGHHIVPASSHLFGDKRPKLKAGPPTFFIARVESEHPEAAEPGGREEREDRGNPFERPDGR